jgi:hypothetical protein
MNNHFVFSINHFINKFENIQDNECVINKSVVGGKDEPVRKDCIQHCITPAERRALLELTAIPIQVWDGNVQVYSGIHSPPKRLVAFLKDIQKAKEGNIVAINKLKELNILRLL